MLVIKYITSIILMVATLTVTVGVTLHQHFCGKSGEITINIVEKADCHCESDSESSCELSHEHASNCCDVKSIKIDYPIEITHSTCCSESVTTIHLDESFLSAAAYQFLIKYPTEYIRDTFIDVYEKSEIHTWEKRLKLLYSGFKDNLIKFIYLLSDHEREELPEASL